MPEASVSPATDLRAPGEPNLPVPTWPWTPARKSATARPRSRGWSRRPPAKHGRKPHRRPSQTRAGRQAVWPRWIPSLPPPHPPAPAKVQEPHQRDHHPRHRVVMPSSGKIQPTHVQRGVGHAAPGALHPEQSVPEAQRGWLPVQKPQNENGRREADPQCKSEGPLPFVRTSLRHFPGFVRFLPCFRAATWGWPHGPPGRSG